MALIRRSSPRRTVTVATSTSPALATRLGSSKITSMRSIPRDTSVTESASSVLDETATSTPQFSQSGRHFPRMRGYLLRSFIGESRLRLVEAADRRGLRPIGPVATPGGECYRPVVELQLAGGDFISDVSMLQDEATKRLRGGHALLTTLT